MARSSQGRTPIFPFPLQFSPPPGLASRGLAAAATRRPHRLDRRPTSAHHETFQISIFPRKYPTRDNETGVGAVQDTQDRRASLADSVKSRPRSLHIILDLDVARSGTSIQRRREPPRISRRSPARSGLFNPRTARRARATDIAISVPFRENQPASKWRTESHAPRTPATAATRVPHRRRRRRPSRLPTPGS